MGADKRTRKQITRRGSSNQQIVDGVRLDHLATASKMR
jgi:hypothetical protein